MVYDIELIKTKYEEKKATIAGWKTESDAWMKGFPQKVYDLQQQTAQKFGIEFDLPIPSETEPASEAKDKLRKLRAFLQSDDPNIAESSQILHTYEQTKVRQATANQLTEFFKTYQTFTENMEIYQRLLQSMADKETVDETEKKQIKRGIRELDTLISAYQALSLTDCIHATPLETMEALATRVSSRAFEDYAAGMFELVFETSIVGTILHHHANEFKKLAIENNLVIPSVDNYTLMPMQYIAKLPLLFRDLKQKFDAESNANTVKEPYIKAALQASDSFNVVDQYCKALNTQKRFLEQLEQKMEQKGKDNKEVLLRGILDLHLNTPLQEGVVSDFVSAFISDRLRQIITEHYPMNEDILKALGISNMDENCFEVSRYDAAGLLKLFLETKDPLWLVLMSTSDVNENCSLKQKVEAYIGLAEQFYKGKLGKTEKYYGALNMAQDAYALANATPDKKDLVERVKRAFGFSDEDFKPRTCKAQAESKQFGPWIQFKIKEHASETKGHKNPRAQAALRICDDLKSVVIDSAKPETYLERASVSMMGKKEKDLNVGFDDSSSDDAEFVSETPSSDDGYIDVYEDGAPSSLVANAHDPDTAVAAEKKVTDREGVIKKLINHLESYIQQKEPKDKKEPLEITALHRGRLFRVVHKASFDAERMAVNELKALLLEGKHSENAGSLQRGLNGGGLHHTIALFMKDNPDDVNLLIGAGESGTSSVLDLVSNLLTSAESNHQHGGNLP